MITEEQIWAYLDGNLSEADRKDFERSIAADKQDAALFKQISSLHLSLKNQDILEPSLLFADKVMASLNIAPAYTPPAKTGYAAWLIFTVPIVAVITGLGILLAYNHIQIAGAIPTYVPMPSLKHPLLYFVVIDIVVLAYFMENLSEYRFNRKALFS